MLVEVGAAVAGEQEAEGAGGRGAMDEEDAAEDIGEAGEEAEGDREGDGGRGERRHGG